MITYQPDVLFWVYMQLSLDPADIQIRRVDKYLSRYCTIDMDLLVPFVIDHDIDQYRRGSCADGAGRIWSDTLLPDTLW